MKLHALVSRIAQMDRREIAWRGTVAVRTAAQRLRHRVAAPRWDRGGITEETVRRIRARRPRFVLAPDSRATRGDAIRARWPEAASAAQVRANRILAGEYDLLGYRGLRFSPSTALGAGDAIDWHFDPVHQRRAPQAFWADVPYLDPSIGDHKVIWELNRHQHWIALGRAYWLTGDHRYRDRIALEFDSWMRANPPLTGINWASMLEIGFRVMSWIWALHFLLDDDEPEWMADLLAGLQRQLTHLEQNLSYYFSPNTHLTGEALALYVAGVALPELHGSERWRRIGRDILLAEIDRQILPDGGHAERSTHYQRYTLDFYLLALMTAEIDQDADAQQRFADAATRLARFTRAMANDRGRLPLIGDDDGGMLWPLAGRECVDVRDSLALAAVLLNESSLAPWGVPEEVYWLAGADRAAALAPVPAVAMPSRVMTDTGYAVLRGANGDHAVFDVGDHGYMNAGHAHADALALTLTLGHRPLLVDPGTSTYTVDPTLRDRMRSSASHNTLTIDGRSSALPSGPFHWQSRATARVAGHATGGEVEWIGATHDGYAPLTHRRTIVRTGQAGWFVVDEVLGAGEHVVDAHWHFDPAWMIASEGDGVLRATHLQGEVAWLATDSGSVTLSLGNEESGLGWHAPVYGTLVPAWSARARHAGPLPLVMVTWIGTSDGRPRLTRLRGEDPAVIAVRVECGDRVTEVTLPGDRQGARVTTICQSTSLDPSRLLVPAARGRVIA